MPRARLVRFSAVTGCMLLVMAGGVDAVRAQWPTYRVQGFDLVRRATYTSQSGVYALEVDPHDPTGLGRYGAAYRFSVEGKRIWAGERLYTLREVVITDAGAVVGFAYRNELLMGPGECLDPLEHFHIVIIDRHGKEILNDVTERPALPFAFSPPLPRRPYAEQLIVDSDNDRIVVRVVEPNGILGRSIWWIYRLSTGDLLRRFDPEILTPDSSDAAWVAHAQPVLETPLMGVHCVVVDRSSPSSVYRVRLALVNLSGKGVWTLDLEDDYTAHYEKEASKSLSAPYAWEHPAILRSDSPKRFEIRSFVKGERIVFGVDKDSSGSWVISELSRTKYEEPTS
jgi:hypothetical protein